MLINSSPSLLSLLQLVSPALPVGAYTYSEGLETLVQSGQIADSERLQTWLLQELRYGAMRLEAAVLVRAYRAASEQPANLDQIYFWNEWLSALRETRELREQSWQMGRSLTRLLETLQPQTQSWLQSCEAPLNFAVVFAVAAWGWQIELEAAVSGYLQSWAANLVNAGVRLIPLGQTQGQQILLGLQPQILQTSRAVLTLSDEDLACCSWGVSIASMQHETLYSRLFRS
jgi:urease accessory protein